VTSGGQIKLKKILAMLDACAPGYRIVAKEHRQWVTYQGHTYRRLPLGAHGKRSPSSVEIEVGQVRRLIRYLAIDPECASKHLAQLR